MRLFVALSTALWTKTSHARTRRRPQRPTPRMKPYSHAPARKLLESPVVVAPSRCIHLLHNRVTPVAMQICLSTSLHRLRLVLICLKILHRPSSLPHPSVLPLVSKLCLAAGVPSTTMQTGLRHLPQVASLRGESARGRRVGASASCLSASRWQRMRASYG